jgi:CDP-glucose 4,6-dehydratase
MSMKSFWKNRMVLVTGATGLLGSRLTRDLVMDEADVVCLIRDWVPQSELSLSGSLEQTRIVRGSVQDQALMERVLGEYEIATVFHLAAQTIVGIANRNPISTFESNIQGTWALLEACRRSPKVEQIVIASSDKAYGDQEQLPYQENAPLQGRHPYDVSKSCADLIAQTYAHTYGSPVTITRCGNLFGAGDLNWNRIVPGTIRSILEGTAPVIRSDGEFVRDYFHVDDASLAYRSLVEKMAERPQAIQGQAFNFSYERPISVKALVDVLLKLTGSQLNPEILNQASNEIRNQFLSSGKAREILGWSPQREFEEALKSTIEWYRTFLDRDSAVG